MTTLEKAQELQRLIHKSIWFDELIPLIAEIVVEIEEKDAKIKELKEYKKQREKDDEDRHLTAV